MNGVYQQYRTLLDQWDRTDDKAAWREGLRALVARCEAEGRAHWQLFLTGRLAAAEDRLDDAIRLFDELLARPERSEDPDDLVLLAETLRCKAVALGEQGKSEEEIAVCDEVVRRYGDASVWQMGSGLDIWQIGKWGQVLTFNFWGRGRPRGDVLRASPDAHPVHDRRHGDLPCAQRPSKS